MRSMLIESIKYYVGAEMLSEQLELSRVSVPVLLTPRLTTVITTVDAKGRVNAAPYSFFMPISYAPPRVCFSVNYYKHNDLVYFDPDGDEPSAAEVLALEEYVEETESTQKDTLANILESGEFGVNILPIEYLHQMEITSGVFPLGESEMEMADLTPYPSTKIKPPLIREAIVGLECVKVADYVVDSGPHWVTLVVGEGVAVHTDSEIVVDDWIQHEQMRSILEFASDSYGVSTDLRHEPYIRTAEAIAMLRAKRQR